MSRSEKPSVSDVRKHTRELRGLVQSTVQVALCCLQAGHPDIGTKNSNDNIGFLRESPGTVLRRTRLFILPAKEDSQAEVKEAGNSMKESTKHRGIVSGAPPSPKQTSPTCLRPRDRASTRLSLRARSSQGGKDHFLLNLKRFN